MMTKIKTWLRDRWGWTAAICAGILGLIGISSVVAALRKRDRPQPPGLSKAEGAAEHKRIDEELAEGMAADDAYLDSLEARIAEARGKR